jgi:hypothetical protein
MSQSEIRDREPSQEAGDIARSRVTAPNVRFEAADVFY